MTHTHRAAPDSLGWLAPIALGSAIAVAAIAVANSVSRNHGTAWSGPVFWIAIVALIVPTAARLLTPNVVRSERLGLVVGLIAALYLVKVVFEPTQFALHDELGQLRTTHDISTTGHLYSFNPIVRAYSYFPGLNLATAALVKTCHVSTFTAGTLIVGIAHLAGGVSLYLLLCSLTKSERLAAIGLLVYVSNPNFLYFDAQYAYESLALQLAFVALFAVELGNADRALKRWPLQVFASVLVVAVVVTHHLTSYWLVVMLLAWSLVSLLRRQKSRVPVSSVVPACAGIIALIAALAWQLGVVRGAVGPELDPISKGIKALADQIRSHSSGGKTLFQSNTGHGNDAAWAQFVGFASVGMAVILIPVGLVLMARGHGWRHPLTVMLALSAVLLPATLALRLTLAGTETSNRASEFLYVGLAVVASAVAALPLANRADTAPRTRRTAGSPRTGGIPVVGLITAYLAVMFVGGFIVGWPPFDRQPGPYRAAADARSVASPDIAAALWARRHLPAKSFIAADEIDGLLMSAYAELNPQTGTYDGVPVSALFYSRVVGPQERTLINGDKIAYVIVDRRMSRLSPYAKGYFVGAAPAGVNPSLLVPTASLAKFDKTAGFSRVYDSGSIAIYATGLR